jgi:copper homeostasis protein
MIVEICANSFESARIARECGANRIELCTELSVGGLTPSHGLIEKVVAQLDIPVHVLIRPRSGNFVYSEAEVDVMLRDIALCKELGCAGIVSGVLTSENTIDKNATRVLVDASEGMEFTFHRAFDLTTGTEYLDTLLELGVTRLLSSGLKPTAIEGIEFLKKLKAISEGKIQIMPGSGINSTNALEFKKAGFEMIHFSAIKKQLKSNTESLAFGSENIGTSDPKEILKIIELLS